MAASITSVRYRAERNDIMKGRVTGISGGETVSIPVNAREIIQVTLYATDGSPAFTYINGTRATAVYIPLTSNETFDYSVIYVRGSGATLTLSGTGTTTTTTTTGP